MQVSPIFYMVLVVLKAWVTMPHAVTKDERCWATGLPEAWRLRGLAVCALQMFERETARERNLEKAAREAKNKARKEAGKAGETERALTDEDLQQVGLA